MNFTKMNGLLFYLSGESFEADFAKGSAKPTFCEKVHTIEDGAYGKAIQCENAQKLAWKAPHNIYAERGTLSYFWRSRYPVGPTEFPIFRVGYADHSSWDACWLRIDYNGGGFDAMVTDSNLSKTRVSVCIDPFPKPEEWIHLALAWDENYGIKFFVNGKLVAEEYRPGVYYAGLDQFGPHSRIIANWNVISDYNFIRGGDIDEITIYDRMLDAESAAKLAKGELVDHLDIFNPDVNCPTIRKGWVLRNGFEPLPPSIPAHARVKKIEIHDAYDLKRWWWKACDGIRETTWPGVYNRSRLKGRNDYFQLPDWDCYSLSGKSITFTVPPQEEYNHIEISGSAFGTMELLDEHDQPCRDVLERVAHHERTVHITHTRKGGKIRFTNVEREEPIGDFSLFNVTCGEAPTGSASTAYSLAPGYDRASLAQRELADFIKGRHTLYERHIMTAVPCGAQPAMDTEENELEGYPFVNIMVPYEYDENLGLDGVELIITAPAGASAVPFAVQIKDPLWYYRNMAHFLFSAQPGETKTIWFDLRDRILPQNRCLYITLACGSTGMTSDFLRRAASVKLIYKSAADAKTEHVADRFIQVRDVYGHLAEEHPGIPEFALFNRFYADISDLLKVEPQHKPGQYYFYDKMVLNKKYASNIKYTPYYKTATVPEGVPAWAFKQIEFLRHYKYLINWYIDNRQIENGEFGGGLSDDGDFTARWVGLIQLGSEPEKVLESLERCTDAFYDQGMFTNGLPSIQTDELHAAEEGLISLGQCLAADFSNPKHLERVMETARSLFWLTGLNKAGHRHIRSSYFSGSKMATEEPWGVQQWLSYLPLSPVWQLVRYNGNPKLRQLLIELADGLAAHYHEETGEPHCYIRFEDDAEIPPHNNRLEGESALLYPAYVMTGNRHYFDIIPERHKTFDIRMPYRGCADKTRVAQKYEELNFLAGVREYYNTEGHPWIDRVYCDSAEIEFDRLGGVANAREYPRNRLCWRFGTPGDDEKIAILSPVSTDREIKLIVCNISREVVHARAIGSDVLPGIWTVCHGSDTNEDDLPDEGITAFDARFERSVGIELSFPPGKITIVQMELKKQGKAYWDRYDLGMGKEDIMLYPHGLNVRIHSLGSVPTPEATIVLKNACGAVLKTVTLPPLEAPVDLWPRWRDVTFNLYHVDSLKGCLLEIDPDNQLCEITRENNIVRL